MISKFYKYKKVLIPIGIILVTYVLIKIINLSAPTAQKCTDNKVREIIVEVSKIKLTNYQLILESQGSVKPMREATLVAQLSGVITKSSKSFNTGGSFTKNQELLKIDDRDYLINLKMVKASLKEADYKYKDELARSAQAKADWERLGNEGEPNNLVLRKPQLALAQASLDSARAQVEKARLDLARTSIKAPYDGRIVQKYVDVGQYVNMGTPLADIYGGEYLEVRLPLNKDQQGLLFMPEEVSSVIKVELKTNLSNTEYAWQGFLSRSEAALDDKSRQLYVVAQIDLDSKDNLKNPPLKIGEYVRAYIQAKTMDNVVVINSQYIYEDNYVIVLNDGILERRFVEILWKNSNDAIIKSGLKIDELLVTTPLSTTLTGTRAKIKDEI